MQLSVLGKGHGFPLPIPTTPNGTGHTQVNIQHTKDTYLFPLCLPLSFLRVAESIFSMEEPFHVWPWAARPAICFTTAQARAHDPGLLLANKNTPAPGHSGWRRAVHMLQAG